MLLELTLRKINRIYQQYFVNYAVCKPRQELWVGSPYVRYLHATLRLTELSEPGHRDGNVCTNQLAGRCALCIIVHVYPGTSGPYSSTPASPA
eukprot:958029-Rhodomonas_salina.1